MKNFKQRLFSWIIAAFLILHCAAACLPYLQYTDSADQTQGLSLMTYITFPYKYTKTVDVQITERFQAEMGEDYEFDINAIVWGNILLAAGALLFAFFQMRFGSSGAMSFFTLIWSIYGLLFYFTNRYMSELAAGTGIITRYVQVGIFAVVLVLSALCVVNFVKNYNNATNSAGEAKAA